MQTDDKALRGKVAVVAGATRGAGRAIAVELGAAGADQRDMHVGAPRKDIVRS